jgi:hypothetical protein
MLRTNRSAGVKVLRLRWGLHRLHSSIGDYLEELRGEQWVAVVNEAPFSIQDSLLRIREIPRDLAHPQSVPHQHDARDLHLPRTQLDEEQNHKPPQPSPGPHFHGEEIGCYNQLPMSAQKLLPPRLPAPLRRRLDSVPFQDLRDGAAGKLVSQVG